MELDKNSKILVTGGNGFLGKQVVKKLRERGYNRIGIPRSFEYDLTKETHVQALFNDHSFDVVIHLAAKVGGIGYNKDNPSTAFYDNMMMNILLQEYSRRNNIKKFIGIGSVCEYPKFTEVPFKEENLWEGYPEETNAPYGLSKKMMLVQGQAYEQEFNFKNNHLLMVNLYGPGGSFDPRNSHVVDALVKRIVDAKRENKEEITMWGTGSASREFLYVEDAAEAVVLAMENLNNSNPVNIGSGMEITIRDLTNKIVSLVGYQGKINWDSSQPDGQPRRCLNIDKAKEFGFKAETDFDLGLKNTINWYVENHLS